MNAQTIAQDSFEKWFDIFWETYPKDLLYNTKGAREGPFKNKLKATKPEVREKILNALREQIRYKRKLKQAGEEKPMWCFPAVSVWVNQKRWTVEIPSQMEIDKTTKPKVHTCTFCQTEVKHKGVMCAECDKEKKQQYDPEIRSNLIKAGIIEEGDDDTVISIKCRERLPELVNNLPDVFKKMIGGRK